MKMLRYAFLSMLHPNRRDFTDMGFGIEARYKRAKRYWRNHLELSSRFQREALSRYPACSSAAILGAGRLLDVPQDVYISNFEKIALYDADPGVLPSWRRFKAKLKAQQSCEFHLQDLTACLDRWTSELKSFLNTAGRSPEKLAEFLDSLECTQSAIELACDVLVSLNLLSQIPIYWRDRVQALVLAKWKLDTSPAGDYEPILQDALEVSMQKLQSQHLSLLNGCSAKVIVLISDSEFYYYQKDRARWQVEKALWVPSDIRLKGYTEFAASAWLWHISPQDIEQADYGSIHRVAAKAWVNDS